MVSRVARKFEIACHNKTQSTGVVAAWPVREVGENK
jgi:hypothetical protein